MDGTSIAERKWTEGQRKGLSTWSVWVFTGLLKVLSLMHWEIKKKKKQWFWCAIAFLWEFI